MAKSKYVVKTKDGKSYPTNNKNWTPSGYSKGDVKVESSNKSSSSSSSSSSRSSSNSKEVYASRVPVGGDESQREYSVNGQWVKEVPKKSSGGYSSKYNPVVSNKGQTAEIIMNNTQTGETTRTVQDLDSGKTISKTTTRNQVQQIQARERQTEQSNVREELSRRVQSSVSSEIRERQQYAQIQQSVSMEGKLPAPREEPKNLNVMTIPEEKTYDDPDKTWFGNKFDKYSDKLKTVSYDLRFKGQEEAMKGDNANPVKTLGYNAGAFVAGGVVSVKEMIIDPARTPIKSTKEVLEGAVDLSVKSSARQELSRKAGEFGQKLQSGDPIAAGQAVVGLSAPEIPGRVIKAAGSTTRAARFSGKVEAPIEDYVHADVISGKTRMPSAKGTSEIVEGYKKAEGNVVTFSPQKLGKVNPETGTPTSNPFKGEQVAGDTRKGAMGMEDGGINVAPKGQGTTYFLRMGDEMQSSQYTLNPKKWWESVKSEFQTPTATEFQTRGVVKPPKKVLDEPGFEGVKNWQKEELAGTGKVSVTKRSMIGQGELPSKTFKNERKGGKVERELGTSEYELTIPQGQEFVQSGIKKYIKVDGKKVAIREAEMVISKTDDFKLAKQQKLITAKKLIDEQRSLNSSFGSRTKYKSPVGQFSRFGSGFSSNKSAIPSSSAAGSSVSGGSSPGKSGSSVSGGSSGGKSFPSGGSPGSSPGGSSGGGSGGSSGGGSSGGSSFFGSSGGSSGRGSSFPAPPYSPKVPRLPSSDGFKPKSKAGYDIFIRENGKRIKANKKPIPYNIALRQGTNIVDNTVAASFELQKRGTTNVPDIPAQVIGDKFRARKTKNALRVVEKSKYRIDTTGEKQGLSVAKFLRRFKL